MTVINGNDLLVTVGATAIACSTSCSLSINQENIPATCKDSGYWASSIEGRASWSVSCSGLYQLDNSVDFTDLANYITNSAVTNSVTLVFGTDDDYWTGTAQIVSVTLEGPENAPSTFSVEFTGVGALVPTV